SIARQIYEWMRKDGKRTVIFGTGRDNGSVYPVFKPSGVTINPAYLSSDGNLWVQFGNLENKPVFGSIDSRRALMQRFNAINGVNFTDGELKKYPTIPLARIAKDPEGQSKVIDAL